jgi:methionyl-tRNA formyltransferase
MSRLRIVFLGTPDFAVPSLRALLDGPDEVVGVVCQPDRPAGRGRRVQAPPVKQLALERGIRLTQPEKVRTTQFLGQLEEWDPDLIIVAAYGRILPKSVLDLPRFGGINVHASLLPKYRGAAPIQWAIARGETVTGVTIMQMSEGMDEGDILLQRETPIGAEETGGQLQERLAVLGAEVLMEALDALVAGTLTRTPQDERGATFAPMIKKEDGRIDWSRTAQDIARQVRAFNPWPSAFTSLGGRLIKIHRARALPGSGSEAPATVVTVGDTLLVTTGSGLLAVEELQLEGRKRLPASAFGRSGVLAVGTRLGEEPETN